MIEIRQGPPTQRAPIQAIQAATLAEPCPELLETAMHGSLPLFVAVGDRPVGYTFLVLGTDDTGYMPELAVRPEKQGEGIGSRLLSTAVQFLERNDYDQLRVTVRAVDERTLEFYDGHGFDRVERLPDHFQSGDALLLASPIT